MILLDTCALLWLATGELPPGVRALIDDENDAVLASAVSAWELAVKLRRGKLTLPLPLAEWWPALVSTHALGEVPLETEMAIASASLPPIHNDPADRLLIATAMHVGATLLTPDPLIRAYPAVKVRWA